MPDRCVTIIFFQICKEMRYDVIGLTDGFGLPDFILKAPIAKYNGDIYPGKEKGLSKMLLFEPDANLFFSLFRSAHSLLRNTFTSTRKCGCTSLSYQIYKAFN